MVRNISKHLVATISDHIINARVLGRSLKSPNRRSMTSTSTPDCYRLKTRFEDDGDTVVHLTSDPDGAPPDETRWSHQRDIGRGASGTVSLQQKNTDGSTFRAVKRMLEPKSHARELNALCDVADVSNTITNISHQSQSLRAHVLIVVLFALTAS